MHTLCLSVVAAMALGQAGTAERPLPRAREAHVPHCLVSLIEEAQIPAEEQGVLMDITVREGTNVRTGALLAKIDDRQVRMAKRVAELELAASEEEARNDVEIRYARAAAAVADAEADEAHEANRKVPGTYSDAEVRRLELNYNKLLLQIEQAQMQQRIKVLSNDVKKAEVEAAQMAMDRRQIDSPLDGIVVELFKHRGEWVQPGEPIMRLVRMDMLRVEGFLRSEDFSPEEVLGREATITVRISAGRAQELKSRIAFVSPLVESSGEYRLWAEVKNEAPNGFYLISPGLTAEMTIHLR